MSKPIEKAKAFATQEHQRINHVRKYSNLPYQTHLQSVAKLVASVTNDEQVIAAAWLHDTVEDTPATLEGIDATFVNQIAELVERLTDARNFLTESLRNHLTHSQDIVSHDGAQISRLVNQLSERVDG